MYTYRPYLNPSSYPDANGILESANRRDNVLGFVAAIERRLTDKVVATVRYRSMDHASNVDVFDYRRSVVGLYFTVRTDR